LENERTERKGKTMRISEEVKKRKGEEVKMSRSEKAKK
jgi:hypothetical protein